MTKTKRSLGTSAAVATVLLLGLALTAVASAADGEEKKIRHMIFVGQDGQEIEVDLDQGGHAWTMDLNGHGKPGAFLGVMLTETTPELRRHLGSPEGAGVLISKVVEGSAAEAAGLKVGDVLAAVDGETVASAWELRRAIGDREIGATVGLEVWRAGELMNLTATLEKGPEGHHGMHRVHKIVRIADDAEGSPCGDAAECNIQVRCEKGGDGCECTVNGESVDCSTLPHAPHE